MRQIKITQQITSRDTNALQIYLFEIGRIPLLTQDEEIELAQRIRQGDEGALEALVRGNLRFVVSVAKQYQHSGVNLLDLINEGNLGLIRAAKKFDETRGFRFITYAVWWVRQAMLQALADQGCVVRRPLNQINLQSKISQTISDFQQENQRKPTVSELSEILDIDELRVADALASNARQTSVDQPLGNDEDATLLDVLADSGTPDTDDVITRQGLCLEMSRTLKTLPDREREIVQMSFGIGGPEFSLEEIGYKMQLSSERVRQLREKAIRRLRHGDCRNLRAYL